MLNCTDVLCLLHRHEHEHVQSRLQDHRAHHEHHVQVMSGDADQIIQNYFNGTTDTELSSLSHLDDPNEGMYILCGVLIAMLFVAVIIVLLAVTIR
ncbi:uncharacterized protein [Halyomorpha halys]|uniref:uncharacterized protein isoform X2 n=1 Tax=Halyomorpha halys TaxID=286706 RepID=UPI0034D3610A